MLIETDTIDWNKPIVYFDGVMVAPALLVSKNYKSSSVIYYMVVVYRETGDAVQHVDKNGCYSNRRLVFNIHSSEKSLIDPVIEDLAGKVECLGEF